MAAPIPVRRPTGASDTFCHVLSVVNMDGEEGESSADAVSGIESCFDVMDRMKRCDIYGDYAMDISFSLSAAYYILRSRLPRLCHYLSLGNKQPRDLDDPALSPLVRIGDGLAPIRGASSK